MPLPNLGVLSLHDRRRLPNYCPPVGAMWHKLDDPFMSLEDHPLRSLGPGETCSICFFPLLVQTDDDNRYLGPPVRVCPVRVITETREERAATPNDFIPPSKRARTTGAPAPTGNNLKRTLPDAPNVPHAPNEAESEGIYVPPKLTGGHVVHWACMYHFYEQTVFASPTPLRAQLFANCPICRHQSSFDPRVKPTPAPPPDANLQPLPSWLQPQQTMDVDDEDDEDDEDGVIRPRPVSNFVSMKIYMERNKTRVPSALRREREKLAITFKLKRNSTPFLYADFVREFAWDANHLPQTRVTSTVLLRHARSRQLYLQTADAALAAITNAIDRRIHSPFDQPPIANVQEFQQQLNTTMCVLGAHLMVDLCDPDRHLTSGTAVRFYYKLTRHAISLTWDFDELPLAFYADMIQSYGVTPEEGDIRFQHQRPLSALIGSFQTVMTQLIGRHNYQMALVPSTVVSEDVEIDAATWGRYSYDLSLAADPNNSRMALEAEYTFNVANIRFPDALQLPNQSQPRPSFFRRVLNMFGEDASDA